MTNSAGKGVLTRRSLLGVVGGALGAGACGLAAWHAAAEDDAPGDGLAAPQAIEVKAKPIAYFQPGQPDTTRFGDLQFRGGLVLTSPSSHFGGWSGLATSPDGKRLMAISDVGSWLTADIDYGERGAPAGLSRARIGPLLARNGQPLQDKREQDAESLALADGSIENGTVLIGFERLHRIGRFTVRGGQIQAPSGYLPLPPEARRMPTNQGFEAVTVLQAGPFKGCVLAFAERFTRGSGYHTGWIWTGGHGGQGGKPERIQLEDIDGFDITDALGLPDGSLLILERYFRWTAGVHMRIRRLMPQEIRPGARVAGHIVMRADQGYEIDNMEGLAMHRGPKGESVLSLISDDNFNHFLQRTVFLQFTLVE